MAAAETAAGRARGGSRRASTRDAAADKVAKPPVAGVSPLIELARQVAVELGGESGRVKVSELAAAVVAGGRHNLKGKTPAATVAAHVYVAAKKGLVFRKVEGERGYVELVDAAAPAAVAAVEDHDPAVTPNAKVVRRGRL